MGAFACYSRCYLDYLLLSTSPQCPYRYLPCPLLSTPISPLRVIPHYSTLHPEDNRGSIVSPYSDSSSNSSHESSPPSPGRKTPPNEDSSAPSTQGGKPVHIDFINPSYIKMKHDEIRIHDKHERTWGWAHGVGW